MRQLALNVWIDFKFRFVSLPSSNISKIYFCILIYHTTYRNVPNQIGNFQSFYREGGSALVAKQACKKKVWMRSWIWDEYTKKSIGTENSFSTSWQEYHIKKVYVNREYKKTSNIANGNEGMLQWGRNISNRLPEHI